MRSQTLGGKYTWLAAVLVDEAPNFEAFRFTGFLVPIAVCQPTYSNWRIGALP
jgi:hypothetical protein